LESISFSILNFKQRPACSAPQYNEKTKAFCDLDFSSRTLVCSLPSLHAKAWALMYLEGIPCGEALQYATGKHELGRLDG